MKIRVFGVIFLDYKPDYKFFIVEMSLDRSNMNFLFFIVEVVKYLFIHFVLDLLYITFFRVQNENLVTQYCEFHQNFAHSLKK